MIKYAKIINEQGQVEAGLGTNIEFYISLGMTQMDVEQSEKDNCWYLTEKCPHYTPEEKRQQEVEKRNKEIDLKIKELNEMSIPELINGNTSNVEVYKNVIKSLEESKIVVDNIELE